MIILKNLFTYQNHFFLNLMTLYFFVFFTIDVYIPLCQNLKILIK